MPDYELTKKAVEKLLKSLDLSGQGFEGTPERVARMWEEFFKTEAPSLTICELKGELDMVMFRGHEFWSFCPHHLLPVKYKLTVAYIPHLKEVLGASKPLRVSDWVAGGLPLQEDIPALIFSGIRSEINLDGFACTIVGEHLCMRMRGVKSPCSEMIVPFFWGELKDEPGMSIFLKYA
jgi:GTP cyclohydrolase I